MNLARMMVWLGCTTFYLATSQVFAVDTELRPNIVLILTDDQPYGYIGAHGNDIINTPNLDALAAQGVSFSQARVSSAICTPSRVSILLGQYERKHGVNFNSGTSVSEQAWHESYPIKLREAGYHTGWIGKNHAPVGKGGYASGVMEKSFDYWYANHGHMRFYPKDFHPIFTEAEADTQLEIVSEGVEDFLSPNQHKFKKAVTFLNQRPVDKPFMLSINLNLPHGASTSSMQMRESDDVLYKTAYREQDIPLPKHYVAKKDIKQPKLPASLLRTQDRQDIYNHVDSAQTVRERYIRQMQAMEGIDRLVGKLRHKLKQLAVADNTVIIFTSDHGLFMGENGLGGKALCYEKTTKVPLIYYDPRTKNTKHNEQALVQNIDIAPTILALAGADIPNAMQGKTITSLVTGKRSKIRDYSYSENLWSTHFGNPRCESVQDNQFKYIRYYQNNNTSAQQKIALAKQLDIPVNKMLYGVHDADIAIYRDYIEAPLNGELAVYEELYDVRNDPDELHNLAAINKYKEELNALQQAWLNVHKKARGTGKPLVERYTLDSQLEKRKDAILP